MSFVVVNVIVLILLLVLGFISSLFCGLGKINKKQLLVNSFIAGVAFMCILYMEAN